MYDYGCLFGSSCVASRCIETSNISAFVPDRINPGYWDFSNLFMTYTVYRVEKV